MNCERHAVYFVQVFRLHCSKGAVILYKVFSVHYTRCAMIILHKPLAKEDDLISNLIYLHN